MVTKLKEKNTNCNKTQIVMKLKTQIVTEIKNSNSDNSNSDKTKFLAQPKQVFW